MRFKEGDRVIHSEYGIGTIIQCDGSDSPCVEYDNPNPKFHNRDGKGKNYHCLWTEEKELKLVEEIMKKKDLKNGDIVTLRNGDRLVLCDECFNDLSGDYSNRLCDLDELRDDLTYKAWDDDSSSDIVKVERPVKYETVFERGEEVKELTVDEISEKLGYKVKVVGLK